MTSLDKSAVHHPVHYNKGAAAEFRRALIVAGFEHEALDLECIEAMRQDLRDWIIAGFCYGNACKYVWRAGDKGDKQQDIEKAVWYLSYMLGLRLAEPYCSLQNRARKFLEEIGGTQMYVSENYKIDGRKERGTLCGEGDR